MSLRVELVSFFNIARSVVMFFRELTISVLVSFFNIARSVVMFFRTDSLIWCPHSC